MQKYTLLIFILFLVITGIAVWIYNQIPPFLFIIGGLFFLAWRKPEFAFYGAIISMPFDLITYDLKVINLSMSDLLIILSSISFIPRVLAQKFQIRRLANIILLPVLFLIAHVISIFSTFSTIWDFRRIMIVIGFVLLVFISEMTIDTERKLRIVIVSVILCVSIEAFFGLIQSVAPELFENIMSSLYSLVDEPLPIYIRNALYLQRNEGILHHMVGTYASGNTFATFVLVGAVLTFTFLINNKISKLNTLFNLSLLLLMLYGIILSYVRGVWIAIVIGFCASITFKILNSRLKNTVQNFAPPILAIVMILMIVFVPPLISSLLNLRIVTFQRRVATFAKGLDIFGSNIQHIFLGIGPGVTTFKEMLGVRRGIHNSFLGVLVGTGLLGFLPFTIFTLMAVVRGIKISIPYHRIETSIQTMALALTATLIAVFIYGLSVSLSYIKLYWLIISLVNVVYRLHPYGEMFRQKLKGAEES